MVVPSTPFPLNVAAGWDTSWRPAKGGKGVRAGPDEALRPPRGTRRRIRRSGGQQRTPCRGGSREVVPLVLHVLPVPGGVPPADARSPEDSPDGGAHGGGGLQVCARRAEQPVESEGGDLGRQEPVRDPGRYAHSRPAGGGRPPRGCDPRGEEGAVVRGHGEDRSGQHAQGLRRRDR